MGANFSMKSKKRNNVLVSFLERFCRLAKPPSTSMYHSLAVDKVTSSTTTVEEVTGSHVFKIEKFSVQKQHARGRSIQSGTFKVGGYDWNLVYYPNGDTRAKQGYASMFLKSNARNIVAAHWTCTGLNKNERELWKGLKSCITTFNGNGWGHPDYVQKWEIESGVHKDDCVVIKCTVTVAKESLQKCG
ncbi:hypothetical protein LUZ61_013269 [Rhynchospora tenuis]|uniref:MATH domain-containing protein n=1 Tax=Rhynchospora tenuis TaxID=198213 RepID=A0AAD5W929_9POAL|nr:hypothetical protein LUZ61_013269 [Rhynchospora tenuis]